MFEVLANLHFLRPWWFLALLPVVWIIWRAWQVNKKQGAWHEVIDPKFRKLLLGENSSTEPTLNEKLGYVGLAIAWFFAVLALSGPWVKSVDVPAQKSQQGIVIVLDLSLSMLADDVSPNRLERVKYTLTDLLKQNPEFAIGMVVYAGSAHTISPISEDNKTLLGLLPSLNPVVMPEFGSQPLLGLERAHDLLQGAKITKGHIIWITDDIETVEVDTVEEWIEKHPYSFSLLTAGTEKGGVVQIPGYGLLKEDDGKLILPGVPLTRFAELEDNADITWQHLKVGVDNTQALLPKKMTSDDEAASRLNKDVNHPLDIGFYFLFLLLPLVAIIFRRGTLLNLAVILVIPAALLQPQPAHAESLLSDLGDVFKSHDQQGYQAWEADEFEKAEALFENRQWRASALYRQGKFSEAAKLFALDKSATGYYNQGNALTRAMQLDDAIKAYEQALLLEPNMQQAKDNLRIAHQLKNTSQAQEQMAQSSQDDQNNQSAASEQSQNQKTDANKSQSNESGQNSEQQSSKNSNQNGDNSSQQTDENGQPQVNGSNGAESTIDKTDQTHLNQNESSTDKNSEQTSEAGQSENASSSNGQSQQGISESADEADSSDKSTNQSSGMQASKLADKPGQAPSEEPAKTLSEEERAQQNWLKQIPDQPGVFLKRKFEYQYQQNPPANNENKKQW